MFQQILDPVGGSLTLSALAAALPLVTLFVLLGGLRVQAWIAGVVSLLVALGVAVAFFQMPAASAGLAATEGAAFGFFPILWIVVNAIWVYNLTVSTGHFDILRRSFERVSPDHRVQAIVIAFCFGALLEALAGFGAPVAITVVMLLALGFAPVRAASVALIANTAPVAFGAMATPIVTLATVTSGASDDPRFTVDTLGSMVGRQTPLLALIVPLILVFVVDGRRGVRQTWPAALLAGASFGLTQFLAANYLSVPLTDIAASLVSAAAVVLLLRVWRPATVDAVDLTSPRPSPDGGGTRADLGHPPAGVIVTGSAATSGPGVTTRPVTAPTAPTAPVLVDDRREVVRAYLPYVMIIALFSVTNIPAVKSALAERPWSVKFGWPGLHVADAAGKTLSSTTFALSWLPAAGTMMIVAGLLTGALLKISPARMLRAYVDTYRELRWAIVTVMAVLALAYVMNLSGQTTTLGVWLAGAGGFFVLLSPILGWLGVAVTGSDTSANALFGALQVQTAAKAGLDPLLLAAANSSGGVLGKMISPQNLAIAAAAVGMGGREGDILRKVLGWSLAMLAVMCLIVVLQATPVLGWMLP